MSKFFLVPVKSIKNLTTDSVNIEFDLSSFDSNLFSFESGQYITIEHQINNDSVRRSYSISSSPETGIEIGVKLVPNGLMSTFLTTQLKEGDKLSIMPPTGNFLLDTDESNNNHYVGIAAGSGITPIMSMIKNVLINEPLSSFTLIYGNKTKSSIMYSDEINLFNEKYNDRFSLYNIYSQEKINDSLFGRISGELLKNLFDQDSKISNANSFFICGPGNMIENVRDFLDLVEIEDNKIKYELFSAPTLQKDEPKEGSESSLISNVTVCVDGDDFEFKLPQNGQSILDAAMEAGADVPFSCKGGVCSVCKAKIIEGTAKMDMNYSLSEDDVEEGFVLTCQAHPTSENIYIDYDEM